MSPLTTLYSPSPFLTFLPVGVVTVFFGGRTVLASGRPAARSERVLGVREPLELFELPELFDEVSVPPL